MSRASELLNDLHSLEEVAPEERQRYTEFTKALKKRLQNDWGLKLRTNTSGTVRPNPFIGVMVADHSPSIPNDFRLRVVQDLFKADLTDDERENVNYGNVRDNYITLRYSEWVELLGENP